MTNSAHRWLTGETRERIDAAAKAIGYTLNSEPDPGTAGPELVFTKDKMYLCVYGDSSAKLYTAAKLVFMQVGPFQFPIAPEKFAYFEGLLICAKTGAEMML